MKHYTRGITLGGVEKEWHTGFGPKHVVNAMQFNNSRSQGFQLWNALCRICISLVQQSDCMHGRPIALIICSMRTRKAHENLTASHYRDEPPCDFRGRRNTKMHSPRWTLEIVSTISQSTTTSRYINPERKRHDSPKYVCFLRYRHAPSTIFSKPSESLDAQNAQNAPKQLFYRPTPSLPPVRGPIPPITNISTILPRLSPPLPSPSPQQHENSRCLSEPRTPQLARRGSLTDAAEIL